MRKKWSRFCVSEETLSIHCFFNTSFVFIMSIVFDILNDMSKLCCPEDYVPPTPRIVEAVSLLGNTRQRKKECSFQCKEHFVAFLKDSGIASCMKRMKKRKEKKGGYTAYTWTCPLPQGNPFFLQYHENSDGSCSVFLCLVTNRLHYKTVPHG